MDKNFIASSTKYIPETTPVTLKEVNRVEILTLIDNYVDVLLESTDIVTRPPLSKGKQIPTDTLLAEHGLSLLVTVYQDKNKHSIILDAGYTEVGLMHNLEGLEVDLGSIEAVVLSHGHMDHTGALYAILDTMPRQMPLVVHPHAFLSHRYFKIDNNRKLRFPQTLIRSKLKDLGVEILDRKKPTLLADDTILVTGEVERVTSFEKGMPNAIMEQDGKLVKDPIADDQSLVILLKGKGLVVISGCAHSGIINTILCSRNLTGAEKVHAVLGGFHLSGSAFEPIIGETVLELKKFSPEVLVPMHCTGWKAIQRFSNEFPASFILNSVGSHFVLS